MGFKDFHSYNQVGLILQGRLEWDFLRLEKNKVWFLWSVMITLYLLRCESSLCILSGSNVVSFYHNAKSLQHFVLAASEGVLRFPLIFPQWSRFTLIEEQLCEHKEMESTCEKDFWEAGAFRLWSKQNVGSIWQRCVFICELSTVFHPEQNLKRRYCAKFTLEFIPC